jgi:ribosome-binding ATPase YchF (GTP1/OBG family)
VKIANFGLSITPGKQKYTCESFEKLVKKFSPKKISPYVVEFIGEDFAKADAVVFDSSKKLDFIFIDLEKIENRQAKTADEKEKEFLKGITSSLEKENLLCDQEFNEEEKNFLKNIMPVTFKPCVGVAEASDINSLIDAVLKKSQTLLFYTAGEKEVHAWEVKKGSTIVEAAGKIHTDLARGFIKGEVIDCKDLDSFFNLAEARARGFAKSVDRDYMMQEGNIIEIKFSV